jgi:hypothetical protein
MVVHRKGDVGFTCAHSLCQAERVGIGSGLLIFAHCVCLLVLLDGFGELQDNGV